jgi:hypothetical protein
MGQSSESDSGQTGKDERHDSDVRGDSGLVVTVHFDPVRGSDHPQQKVARNTEKCDRVEEAVMCQLHSGQRGVTGDMRDESACGQIAASVNGSGQKAEDESVKMRPESGVFMNFVVKHSALMFEYPAGAVNPISGQSEIVFNFFGD